MGSTAKIPVYDGSRENKIVLFCLSFSGSVPLKIVNMFKVCSMPNIAAGFTKRVKLVTSDEKIRWYKQRMDNSILSHCCNNETKSIAARKCPPSPPLCKQNLYLTEFRVDSRTASLKDPANFYLIVEQVPPRAEGWKTNKALRRLDSRLRSADFFVSPTQIYQQNNKPKNMKTETRCND